jgi:hypothetical protein
MVFENSKELTSPRTFCRLFSFISLTSAALNQSKTLGFPKNPPKPDIHKLLGWNGSECDEDEAVLLAKPFWKEAQEVFVMDHIEFLDSSEEIFDLLNVPGKKTRFEEFIPEFRTRKEFEDMQAPNCK